MKKAIIILLTFLIFFPLLETSYALKIITKEEEIKLEREVSREEVFNFFGDYFESIPTSYKYIELRFDDIEKNSQLYSSLQRLVYLDLIKNVDRKIRPEKTLNSYYFFKLSESIFGLNIITNNDKKELSLENTKVRDLGTIGNMLKSKSSDFLFYSSDSNLNEKKKIFLDVYKTILESHYDNENIKEEDIIYSAIKGLADGTGDKYTIYFSPFDNKDFIESLNGKYEGIGAYVDMEKPGEVIIISPIVGGPAEKAGVMGGDIIIGVDGVKIKENNSLKEVISWIKGPAGTEVELEIKRGEKIINIKIVRNEIIIDDVEYELMSKDTFYIQIKNFGINVDKEFKDSLENLKSKKSVKKIIIDLRNNPGGYLEKVVDILGYFVPKGETTAVVKSKGDFTSYKSKGYDLVDFSKYNVVILQNAGSASASEIMIGTIKDYYPNVVLIGTKTYGKGSVQTIKPYVDGSTLKYTVAKWFTGKTETGIDGIGIKPTIELELDIEEFKENGSDNQLDKALIIK